jgi:hypothetical protein
MADDLLTPEQLSKRLQLSLASVYNKLGQLTEEDGVLRLGPRCTRIEWTTFMDRLRKGKIKFRPKE